MVCSYYKLVSIVIIPCKQFHACLPIVKALDVKFVVVLEACFLLLIIELRALNVLLGLRHANQSCRSPVDG